MASLRPVSSGSRGAYHRLDDSRPAWNEAMPMANVAKKQLQFRFAGAETAAALLDWYDRERRDLPWRARKGRKADAYRGLAVRDHAAADDRQGGHPLLRELPGALADGRGAGGGHARRRFGCVGGARLLQPRAQSAQVRADRGRGAWRAAFRRRRRVCASCRASAPTRPRRSRPSPSARATTPVDGNIERVVARLFAVKDAAAGGQARDQAARRAP